MLQKKIKMLKTKLKYLQADLDYHEELFNEFDGQLRKSFAEYSLDKTNLDESASNNQAPPPAPEVVDRRDYNAEPTNDPNKQVKTAAKNELSDSYKKLYKAIAFKTHPDRLKAMGDLAEEDIEKHKQLYVDATKAVEQNNMASLLSIAHELGIDDDIVEPSEAIVELLEAQLKEITENISKIESTTAWIWGHSSDKQKQKILNHLYEVESEN